MYCRGLSAVRSSRMLQSEEKKKKKVCIHLKTTRFVVDRGSFVKSRQGFLLGRHGYCPQPTKSFSVHKSSRVNVWEEVQVVVLGLYSWLPSIHCWRYSKSEIPEDESKSLHRGIDSNGTIACSCHILASRSISISILATRYPR